MASWSGAWAPTAVRAAARPGVDGQASIREERAAGRPSLRADGRAPVGVLAGLAAAARRRPRSGGSSGGARAADGPPRRVAEESGLAPAISDADRRRGGRTYGRATDPSRRVAGCRPPWPRRPRSPGAPRRPTGPRTLMRRSCCSTAGTARSHPTWWSSGRSSAAPPMCWAWISGSRRVRRRAHQLRAGARSRTSPARSPGWASGDPPRGAGGSSMGGITAIAAVAVLGRAAGRR